jgi:hypothetical protein
MILVGLGTMFLGNELMAWDAEHGIENTHIRNSSGSQLRVDHEAAGSGGIEHGFNMLQLLN